VALRTRRNILVSGNGSANVSAVETASVGTGGGVRIARLSINSVVLYDILECVVHEAAVASHVALCGTAVDKVLFREADEASSNELVLALHGSSGGEGPAGTALSLVLDCSDGALLPPINFSRKRWVPEFDEVELVVVVLDVNVVVLEKTLVQEVELLVGEVSELVNAQGICKVEFVLGLDVVEVDRPDVEPLLELVSGIALLVYLHPSLEEELLVMRIK